MYKQILGLISHYSPGDISPQSCVCEEKAKNTPAVYCPQLRRMLVLQLKMAISPLSSSQGSVSKLNFTLG